MERIDAFTAAGRRLQRGDFIRIEGEPSRLYLVRHLARTERREWLELWGPVDKRGTRLQMASYRSVPLDMLKCKARIGARRA